MQHAEYMRNANKIFLVKREGNGQLGRRSVNRRTILTLLIRKQGERLRNGVHVAQRRDKWRAVVNAVMKLRIL
jgi:hypothetical protein